MNKPLTIHELSDSENSALATLEKFNEIRPVECKNCGFKGKFDRKFFHLLGIADESDYDLIRFHLKRTHNIEWCLFRLKGKDNFAEVATCPKCSSTKVVFDISLNTMRRMLKKAKDYLHECQQTK